MTTRTISLTTGRARVGWAGMDKKGTNEMIMYFYRITLECYFFFSWTLLIDRKYLKGDTAGAPEIAWREAGGDDGYV